MEYLEKFIELINCSEEEYIGHGNPSAKILFLGQEGASDQAAPLEMDGRNDYIRSIAENRKDWTRNIHNSIGYDNIAKCCTPETLINYNPLFPYLGQKFQVRSGADKDNNLRGKEGTARTWYNYQKLINRILRIISPERMPMSKCDCLDFHKFTFHSDMSAVVSKKHNAREKGKSRDSVFARIPFFSSDFFQMFPIVIAAVGHFPRETYGIDDVTKQTYFEKVFSVNLRDIVQIGSLWVNININESGKPRLLIHCPQFSANISNEFINIIAEIVTGFAKEHNINLVPDMRSVLL